MNKAVNYLLDTDKKPDIMIISIGYDALTEDPLAGLNLKPDDYVSAIELISSRFDIKKIMLGLEGGYDLAATAVGVVKTCVALQQV